MEAVRCITRLLETSYAYGTRRPFLGKGSHSSL
jgi:hypothetical protein